MDAETIEYPGVSPEMRAEGELLLQIMLEAGTSLDVGLIYTAMQRRRESDAQFPQDAQSVREP